MYLHLKKKKKKKATTSILYFWLAVILSFLTKCNIFMRLLPAFCLVSLSWRARRPVALAFWIFLPFRFSNTAPCFALLWSLFFMSLFSNFTPYFLSTWLPPLSCCCLQIRLASSAQNSSVQLYNLGSRTDLCKAQLNSSLRSQWTIIIIVLCSRILDFYSYFERFDYKPPFCNFLLRLSHENVGVLQSRFLCS